MWTLACLTAYQRGAQRWCDEVLPQRYSSKEIETSTEVSAWSRAMGLHYRLYWEKFREIERRFARDVVADEIEQLAADEASNLAEG